MTTSTRSSRILGAVALAAMALVVVLGLLVSPADQVQRDSVRLMYVHVPSAWLAYLAFFVTAVCSLFYLIPKTRSPGWDRVAGASAEVGVVFTGLAIVTGMVWGRPTWGVFWTWDARLTSTAVLFLLYVGYLALRRLPADPARRAKRSAIVGLVAFANVPIVHLSVVWWRTLHQPPTLARLDLDPRIDDLQLFTLFTALVAFTLVYAWLVLHRSRLAWLEERLADEGLAAALAERQAEASAEAADEAAVLTAGAVTTAGSDPASPSPDRSPVAELSS